MADGALSAWLRRHEGEYIPTESMPGRVALAAALLDHLLEH